MRRSLVRAPGTGVKRVPPSWHDGTMSRAGRVDSAGAAGQGCTVVTSSRFAVATHVLLALSLHRGERLSSAALATTVNTNPVVIRRLLGALQRAGLVETTAGKTGGTELSREPSAITLRDVYEAVNEGELFAL